MNANVLKIKYRENKFIVNTMILAVILIGLLAGSVAFFRLYSGRNELVTDVQTAELQREATLEQIQDPQNLIHYFFKAVDEENLDMALRACPVDEIGLGIDTQMVIENMGEFSPVSTVAPSKQYREYFPLTSAELTSRYTENILAFIDAYQKYDGIQIKKIDYVYPEKQMASENMLRYQTICDTISADAVCEVAVLLEYQGKDYLAGFTLVSYYGGWKLLSFSSELTETTEDVLIREITDQEVQAIYNDAGAEELEEELSDTLGDEEKEERQDSQEIAEMIENGEALLPANYFVVNLAYGESPQDLMEQVTKYIEKGNLQAFMNYYVTDKVEAGERVSSEKLTQQGNVAENIQTLYFALLNEGVMDKGSLETLGKTSQDIVEEQNPGNMFYLDLMKVVYSEENSLCRSFFWYGGNIYEVDFVLQESEGGWQIQEMTDVSQVSQKEYDSAE